MTTRKKTTAEPTIRVRVTLNDPEAKLFTSRGPLLHGSVVERPEDEGRRYCARLTAVPVLEGDEEHKLPDVNVEPDGVFSHPNPNKPGTFRVTHKRQLVDVGNSQVRTEEQTAKLAEPDGA